MTIQAIANYLSIFTKEFVAARAAAAQAHEEQECALALQCLLQAEEEDDFSLFAQAEQHISKYLSGAADSIQEAALDLFYTWVAKGLPQVEVAEWDYDFSETDFDLSSYQEEETPWEKTLKERAAKSQQQQQVEGEATCTF